MIQQLICWLVISSVYTGLVSVLSLETFLVVLVEEKKPPPTKVNPKMGELAHISLSHLLLDSAKSLFSPLQILTVYKGRLGICLVDKHEMEEDNVVSPDQFHPVKSQLCELVSSHCTI